MLGRICAALLLLAATTVALSVNANASPTPSPVAGSARFDTDPGLNARAQLAAEHLPTSLEPSLAATTFNNAYAGTKITSAGLEVSLATDRLAVRTAALPAVVDSVPISIRYVTHSENQLRALTQDIGVDRETWRKSGLVLSEWGPDYDSNKVHVVLATHNAAAERALLDRYGADWVTIDSETGINEPSSSRTTDTSPWYGADYIYHSNGSFCTSNFTFRAHGNGYLYTGTAGHCAGGTWYTNGRVLGNVGTMWYGNRNVDFEDIRVSSGATLPYIWADPNAYTRLVKTYATTDPIGGLICTDGTVDREVCNVRIYYNYQTDCYANQCTYDTVDATQLNGRAAFSSGDSGGPVETPLSSSTTEARGVVISHRNTPATRGNYTPIRFILALDFTLQTG
jgi:hypothetical protein